MASLFTRSLRTTCRHRSLGFLSSSSPTWFNYRHCEGKFDTSNKHEERDTSSFKSSKSACYSTWYLAAAGICSFSSAMLLESSCSSLEEADKESGQIQQNDVRTPRVVFVLGGPGSGKGTQCSKIVKNYGFTHLSAGDLLRAEIRSGSQYGAMIQNTIKEGKIVPSEVTVKLLQKAMKESGNDNFLIDGFPRNEENRAAFETVTGIEPEFVIFFDCTEEEMERRIMNRNQGRADDNIDTIRKRFKVFVESSLPVVEFYKERGKLQKIDATRDIEDIFKSLKPLFTPFVEEDLLRLTKELLQCIDVGDYAVYKRLCDPALTAFEPESHGHLVEGLAFHKFYFDIGRMFPALSSQSQISSPKVTLVGDDAALVTYTRLRQSTTMDGVPSVEAFNETRVWERKPDSGGMLVWKNVHFHRSKSPRHRPYRKAKKGKDARKGC
ncbi:hypothetical protein GOP47_0000110 [Adiantum capillus-veneris]|uniref:UMP-CMP kinase n=1 Tax=Adiantum capillus-veneris TaxID=13818 RepID=A0A9D4VCE9_ADICA|nr:hypothetical protein GOP47_0000110 [Adiantum capillus-veneris]